MARPEGLGRAHDMHFEPLRVIALMAQAFGRLFQHAEDDGHRAFEGAEFRGQDVAMPDLVALDRRQIDMQPARRFPPAFADNAAEHCTARSFYRLCIASY